MPEASDTDAELHRLSNAALALLARRDYSSAELRERLLKRSSTAESEQLIEQVLSALAEQGYQSDERFCESFVRYRLEQGKGPLKIRQDLRLKKIDDSLIDQCMPSGDSFWREHAEKTYRRKFGDQPATEQKEVARRLRFMVSRGYSASWVYPLIDRQLEHAD